MSDRDKNVRPGHPTWRPDFYTLRDLAMGLLAVESVAGGTPLVQVLRQKYAYWQEANGHQRLPTLEMFITRFEQALREHNRKLRTWKLDEQTAAYDDAFKDLITGGYTEEELNFFKDFYGEGDCD